MRDARGRTFGRVIDIVGAKTIVESIAETKMAVASLFEDLLDQYKIEQRLAEKRYTDLYQAYDCLLYTSKFSSTVPYSLRVETQAP